MTTPYGGPGQYPTQSSSAYGAHWPQPTGDAPQRTRPANRLIWVVIVLGLATYLVSCSAAPLSSSIGWGVRFGTFAAVVAALGLLPRQSAHTKLVAALAAMGFLDALAQLISGDHDPNWAAILIVVLNGLQALAAIAALASQPETPGAADRGLALYDAYANYAQAAQQYYAATNQQLQQPVQAQGRAHANAAAPAQAQQSAEESYALYTEYLNAQQPGLNPAAFSAQSGGRTQSAQPAAGTGMAPRGPAESSRQRNDPSTESPTQSSPW
jgi:hypothetical protein